ncbi:phosphonopyruvate decarboxylase [Actinomycetota bacterium]|nr:phosphonopyruvate decarboxylase [Actinomycetota bacterium]
MKLDPASVFVKKLINSGVRVAAGVPDSLLGALSAELDSNPNIEHIKAPNEGLALSAALGYQIASNEKSVVYLQNSGLGNLVNPFLSLFHAEVYNVPALLVMGWRGQFPDRDEPQHRVQGRKTEAMLDLLGIHTVYLRNESDVESSIDDAMSVFDQGESVAILVSKGALGPPPSIGANGSKPERKEWVKCIKDSIDTSTFIISTTGKTSRELYDLQSVDERKRTFYCIGGMGHASSIAAGMARAKPNAKFVCIDGDGAFQMHAGSVALIGSMQPQNLLHILINNGVHESVGGQEITSETYDYGGIAKSTGYTSIHSVSRVEELSDLISRLLHAAGPHFVQCETSSDAPSELGRPSGSPQEWINDFHESVDSDGT